MGVGKLDIGLGKGGAQLFQGDGGAQQFANIIAQQKAERDYERQQLAQSLAQAKPEGLRNDADRQDFYKQYDALKNQAIAADNEPDRFKKAMALANVKQGILNLNDFANKSKERGNIEKQFSQRLWDNNFRNQYSDDAVKEHLKSMNRGLNDPTLVDYDSLERQPDHVAAEKKLNGVRDTYLSGQDWSNGIQSKPVKQGNVWGVNVHQERSVSPEDLLAEYGHQYTVDRDLKHSIDTRYANINGSTPEETQALRLKKLALDRSDLILGKDGKLETNVTESTKPEFRPDRQDPRFSAMQLYNLSKYGDPHGLAGTTAGQLTPSQQMLTHQAMNNDPSKLLSLIPHGQYGNAQPKFMVDPNTGNHVFEFPAQVKPDTKAISGNQLIRANYPKTAEGRGGLFSDPVPFEQSNAAKRLAPETKVVAPAKRYVLNPSDPNYLSQAAQMATEQNVALNKLDKIEAVKGGHGVIPAAQHGVKPQKVTDVSSIFR